MGEFLVPLIGYLLTSYGVLAIGWPGVGKTPLLIVLSLAVAFVGWSWRQFYRHGAGRKGWIIFGMRPVKFKKCSF